ncbi:transcriptional regulator [Methanosalsum natronophilum]|uniref:Helix-turn-helix domain-containing protein n=1 Tax=Methanosalsum natronophilum TaxID=768733 RepID=A0A3R7VY29_9EURY|nr:helix-turn-helix domain-containing protein [Methanosalsum natronophilum]MCS3923657.1 putative transcriptional regulator [Methanosalsum natronophilum]RQD85111.1 MAG: helix-turn-helix domain-containing protein [Methanosalsum natronophilum]
MKMPCQTVVWDVLPAIKAAIVEELVNNGFSQQEIAKKLDTTPSAISQYISKKRGYRIVFEDNIRTSIRAIAEDMKADNVDNLEMRICDVCRQLRDEDNNNCNTILNIDSLSSTKNE